MPVCTHCGTQIDDPAATHCPNCGEAILGPIRTRTMTKAENGWLGAGVGCASYVALLLLMWGSVFIPLSGQTRYALNVGVVILFLLAIAYIAFRIRRPGFLIGYLLVLLVPLGLFAACVGVLTFSTSNMH